MAALVSAGTGTTSIACGRALRTLLKHPDQLSMLRRDRSILPNAVEELLRYDSGLVVMPRYVLEDFDLRGRALLKGQMVLLSLMGANRDPRVFPEPDRVDLHRDTRDALSFGHGSPLLRRREHRAHGTALDDRLPRSTSSRKAHVSSRTKSVGARRAS